MAEINWPSTKNREWNICPSPKTLGLVYPEAIPFVCHLVVLKLWNRLESKLKFRESSFWFLKRNSTDGQEPYWAIQMIGWNTKIVREICTFLIVMLPKYHWKSNRDAGDSLKFYLGGRTSGHFLKLWKEILEYSNWFSYFINLMGDIVTGHLILIWWRFVKK